MIETPIRTVTGSVVYIVPWNDAVEPDEYDGKICVGTFEDGCTMLFLRADDAEVLAHRLLEAATELRDNVLGAPAR